jgi:hypothetical protein
MKKVLPLIIFCLVICLGQAQVLVKQNVRKLTVRGSGTIEQNSQVKGYYTFISVEKKDKNNNTYELSLFDENLIQVSSVEIIRPRHYMLVDGAYNGRTFCFLFRDEKKKLNEMITYDRSLKLVSTAFVPDNEYTISPTQAAQGDPTQAFLVPIDNKGYIYYGVKTGKYQYQMVFFTDSLKRKWAAVAPDDADVELASDAFQEEEYVGSLILRKKRIRSKDIDVDLLVQRMSTGEQLFKIPLLTDKYSVSLSSVYFDREKMQFVVFGEYYDKDDKELKAQSLGFISLEIDMKGTIVRETVNSWADIGKVAPVDAKGKFDKSNMRIMVHNIIKTSDGQFFVVGEQYAKVASGAGIAMQLMSGLGGGAPQAASVQLNIYNMVYLQFNPDFTINRMHLFAKDKTEVLLPAGAGFMSSKQLSFYVRAVGGFDYKYTQQIPGDDTFIVTYIDYDKEKGQKATNMLGSIIYTPEKTFTVDKLKLNRKSTDYFVLKAKTGYVMVMEYFRKEKKLESRLEKLNY